MIKWVARLAFITVLLGLVGTVLIISNLHKDKDGDEIRKDDEKNETQPRDIYLDTLATEPRSKTRERTSTPPAIINKVLPTEKEIEENRTTQEPAKTGERKIPENLVEAGKTGVQNEDKKPPEEKLLAPEELQQLVRQINTAKEEHNIYSNCIQIFTASQSNNKSAASQIETYLRSERFSIAGRETISKKVKGIQITPGAGCIKVTIGAF